MNESKMYFTQIIFIQEGKEDVFNEFEAIAIPKIAAYNGELTYRIRPDRKNFINNIDELPYEVHYGYFNSKADFERFKMDEERKSYLHLFKESVKKVVLIEGAEISR
jgi:hypothetical protein